jgi:hypothetical protein
MAEASGDLQPRANKSNRLGGPVRNGNANPGQGRGSAGSTVPRPRAKKADAPFGKAFPAADPSPAAPHAPAVSAVSSSTAGAAAREEAERLAGRKVFSGFMTTERRESILTAMQKQAELGNVPAARLLLAYDMGNPVSTSEHIDKTPLRGDDVRKAIKSAMAEAEAEVERTGGNVVAFRSSVRGGLWSNDDEDTAAAE